MDARRSPAPGLPALDLGRRALRRVHPLARRRDAAGPRQPEDGRPSMGGQSFVFGPSARAPRTQRRSPSPRPTRTTPSAATAPELPAAQRRRLDPGDVEHRRDHLAGDDRGPGRLVHRPDHVLGRRPRLQRERVAASASRRPNSSSARGTASCEAGPSRPAWMGAGRPARVDGRRQRSSRRLRRAGHAGWDEPSRLEPPGTRSRAAPARPAHPGGRLRSRDPDDDPVVSHGPNASEGNGSSSRPSISADGGFVAFESDAGLEAADTNRKRDVYVWDRAVDGIQRISLARDGSPANGDSRDPSISGDGSVIAFASTATTMTRDRGLDGTTGQRLRLAARERRCVARLDRRGRPWLWRQQWRFDLARRTRRRVRVERSGPRGRHFNRVRDVFLRDLTRQATIRASVRSNGRQVDVESRRPSVSGDGGAVAFDSTAPSLVSERHQSRSRRLRTRPPARGPGHADSARLRGRAAGHAEVSERDRGQCRVDAGHDDRQHDHRRSRRGLRRRGRRLYRPGHGLWHRMRRDGSPRTNGHGDENGHARDHRLGARQSATCPARRRRALAPDPARPRSRTAGLRDDPQRLGLPAGRIDHVQLGSRDHSAPGSGRGRSGWALLRWGPGVPSRPPRPAGSSRSVRGRAGRNSSKTTPFLVVPGPNQPSGTDALSFLSPELRIVIRR